MFSSRESQIIRKFSYKIDQQGIIRRYIEEEGAWESHLQNTKEFILRSAHHRSGTVAVLGSGWCLDVPLEGLAGFFDRVVLVDMVHPRQIEHKTARMKNVELLHFDITGGAAAQLFDALKNHKKTGQKPELEKIRLAPENFGLPKPPDWVISVNLLNQLDILLCDTLNESGLFEEHEIMGFRKTIQQTHIEALPKGKTCLITDYRELQYDENGKLAAEKDLVFVPLPAAQTQDSWRWDFDQNQNYHPEYQTVFMVKALNF